MFDEIVSSALSSNVSVENLESLMLETARYEAGRDLSLALANQRTNPTKIEELINRYVNLIEASSVEEGELGEGVEVFSNISVGAVTAGAMEPGNRIKVYPLALNERLRGGMLPGHHLTLFAPPEGGKTAAAVNAACGFLVQGHPGLYFGNEDPATDIISRIVCNLANMTQDEVEADPEKAQRRAVANGLELLTFVSLSPGTLRQIDQFMRQYKPAWVVVDQLKNLEVKAESSVNQLEIAAQGVRTLGKKYNCRMISITQAGDSAAGKAVLEMSDVYGSKTGIPGACDVLVGIGATREMLLTDDRMLSLPKNKIGGDHSSFPVRLNRYLSRLEKV